MQYRSSFVISLLACLLFLPLQTLKSQELNAKVTINDRKIQGTDKSTIEELQKTITDLLNNKQWTNQIYKKNERINCNFNITIDKYDVSSNAFECTLLVQSTRPVFNSSYTTTLFNFKDANFNFSYKQFDELVFRIDQIDNELTALLGFYAYYIIGLDRDAMSLKGGTDALQKALDIANSAQTLQTKGWKAFDSSKNRFAIINDLLDGAMEPYRKMFYTYHREGLDVMSTNVERGRIKIADAITLLKEAKSGKPLSLLPLYFSEFKRQELVNIFSGHGTTEEKEKMSEILQTINPSQGAYWRKLKK